MEGIWERNMNSWRNEANPGTEDSEGKRQKIDSDAKTVYESSYGWSKEI